MRLSAVQNRIEELNNQIEAGKNTIIDALNSRATIKSKIGRFDTMMEQIAIRKAELTSRLLRAKSDEVKQEETIKQLQDEFEAINGEIRSLNDAQTSIEEKLGQIHDELSAKDQKLRDTQVVYHRRNPDWKPLPT